jgi:hypothetical protein
MCGAVLSGATHHHLGRAGGAWSHPQVISLIILHRVAAVWLCHDAQVAACPRRGAERPPSCKLVRQVDPGHEYRDAPHHHVQQLGQELQIG